MTDAPPTTPSQIQHSDAIDFLSGLPAESVDLIVTDPAYSSMNQHLQLGRGRIVGRYEDRGADGRWFAEFEDTPENYRALLAACHRVLRPDRHIFIMLDAFSLLTLGPLVKELFAVKNVLVWDKAAMGMGHNFRRQTEFILFSVKGKRALSGRAFRDLVRIERIPWSKSVYPTQKPVELFEYMIAASHRPGETPFVVCDPFVGSGSSALAALRQGAIFVGCDVSERAVQIARERVQEFLRQAA